MNQRSTAVTRLPAAVLFTLTPFLFTPASPAATIVVPPVTISQLQHASAPDWVHDGASIPGPGCTTQGFQATIATGDLVVVRIQAPAGKKFVVHAPAGGLGYLNVNVYWNTSQSQGGGPEEPHTVTFENLKGSAPSETYSYVELGTGRTIVAPQKNYTYTSAFEFTAIRFDITATTPYPAVPRNYSIVGSWSDPGFVATNLNGDPLVPVMEIVDMATPAQSTSWGRIKALYR